MSTASRLDRPSGSGALLDGVRQWLAESGAEPTPARVAQALREQGRVLGDAEVLGAAEQLRSELVGSGPLEPLLADPSVTDVLVSAPDRVWVDRGGGLELTAVAFPDAAAVRRLAQRLAAVAGRRLDDARPWADARLPDGTRLHAVLPPVAVGCTCLSLRVVRPRAFTLDELMAAGTVPPGGDKVLRELLRARLSFLISGGTGSGKTTLLSALLGLVGPGERIVLAEDSAELRPDHPHVVRLETRPANQEGAGLVTLEDLVRQALRMRPDRLVVGEVRGPEVVHLLAALNTGHEGGCGTFSELAWETPSWGAVRAGRLPAMPNLLIKDLRVIAKGFSNDVKEWPNIPCPTCGRGNMIPAADTFVYEEAEMSKQAQYDPESGWEPDWIYGGFHCILRCGKSTCDLVRVVGNMSVVEDLDERGRWYGNWLVRLTPTFFHPPLPLVQSHEAAPRPVLQRLEAGAAVVWVDPSSAANRLRSAVEALLDDQGIPRRGHSNKGPYDIKLHQRIENFKKAKPEFSDAADALLAAKWIGNVGSHEDALKIADVLDGAEMIDFALVEIYDTSRDAVKKMAAEITARKGMPARKFQGAVSPGGEVSLFGQKSG